MMKNIENNNATVKTWKHNFAENISRQTGFPLRAEMIFSDEKDWDFYITKNSLQEKSPLLLMNYMGELMAVIPANDYKKLDNKEIWPYEYIPKVRWYFGQYLDNLHVPTDVFWQPIEKRVGINDKKKISRYLHMLKCRINYYRTAQMPSDDMCNSCEIQNCPFSKVDSKNVGSDWNKEVQERDYRLELIEEMKLRIKEELGLEVTKVTYHTGNRALLIMDPEYCQTTRDHVELHMPIGMLNFLMYNPVYRNWKQYAKSFVFEIGVANKEKRFVIANDFPNTAEYCHEKFEILCTESPEVVEESYEVKAQETEEDFARSVVEDNLAKPTFMQKMKKMFFGKK